MLSSLIDLLFPPKCLLCGALAEPFCAACRRELEAAEGLRPPAGLEAIRSAGFHEGSLRRAVLRLKFERKVALVQPLADLLAAELQGVRARWEPDALVPVPLHWSRRLERGFNQAELLAERLAFLSGIPVRHALRRTRATGQQVGRGVAERAESIRDAFAPNRKVPVPDRVVLLDDVWTTGATLSECAAVLRNAGASAVFALTVSHERKIG